MSDAILRAKNLHTERMADLVDIDVLFGEAIVYVMKYVDTQEVFRMDEEYEVHWEVAENNTPKH